MIVFHITLAQCDSLPDKGGEASTRSATRRVCLGPDSFPAGERGDALPSGKKAAVSSMLLNQQDVALGQKGLPELALRGARIDSKNSDIAFPPNLR